MFAAVGAPVERLVRVRIGTVRLDDLPSGAVRELSAAEPAGLPGSRPLAADWATMRDERELGNRGHESGEGRRRPRPRSVALYERLLAAVPGIEEKSNFGSAAIPPSTGTCTR